MVDEAGTTNGIQPVGILFHKIGEEVKDKDNNDLIDIKEKEEII